MSQLSLKTNDFTLNFTLKQHTPLIHFQADQKGATLRATELKPKLDRFLLIKLGDGDYNAGVEIAKQKKWLISKGDHPALDYKVRIEPNNSNYKDINPKTSMFFGNLKPKDMVEEEWEKLKKRYKTNEKTFKVFFVSFNTQILKQIKQYFKAFLSNENFGTRQSKGYGGFFIKDEAFDPKLIDAVVYSFDTEDWESDIKLFYQFLRQGINRPKRIKKNGKSIEYKDKKGCNRTLFYCKPFVYYFVNNTYDYTWEKRKIKQVFFATELAKQQKCKPYSDTLKRIDKKPYLVRDLFGLSTQELWKSYNNTTLLKIDSEKNITRFKSPITFKVIDKKVYFWVNDSYRQLLGKRFQIKNAKTNRIINDMKFPSSFDFNKMFEALLGSDFDFSEYVFQKFKERDEYENLKRIIDSLRKED